MMKSSFGTTTHMIILDMKTLNNVDVYQAEM